MAAVLSKAESAVVEVGLWPARGQTLNKLQGLHSRSPQANVYIGRRQALTKRANAQWIDGRREVRFDPQRMTDRMGLARQVTRV